MWVLQSVAAALLLGCLEIADTDAVTVTGLSPYQISMGGGLVTITGSGFSTEDYDPDAPSSYRGGNKVSLQRDLLTLDCPIVHHYTNDEQIVCIAPDTDWQTDMRVYISVDGAAPYRSNTYVRYKWSKTPTFRKALTRYAAPGTPLKFEGKLFTSRTSAAEDDPLFMSASVGDYVCDLNNPLEDNALYGISLFNNQDGTFICRPRGIIAGYYNALYKVTELGYSKIDDKTWSISQMNNKHELYVQQILPEVQSISPSDGSVVGGQTVTVTGRGFVESLTSVEIGGVPCDVQSVTPIEVVCVTGSQPDEAKFYPGDNGALVEIWRDDYLDGVSQIGDLNSSVLPYEIRTIDEFNYPRSEASDGSDYYISAKARGYLVIQKSAYYSLVIRSDDESELYMSMDGNPDNLTKMAYNDRATSDYFRSANQKSEKMWLEAGERYYLEMYINQRGGPWYFGVGIFIHETDLTRDDWKWARDEKQYLKVIPEVNDEMQYVDVNQTTGMMTLQFQGRQTTAFNSSDLNATEITGYIEDLFRAECTDLQDLDGLPYTGDVLYSEDYESEGNSGDDPYCGARIAYNPNFLFSSDEAQIDIQDYNKICFALRGNHTGTIYITGTKLNNVTFVEEGFRATTEAAVPLDPSLWVYQCVDFSILVPSDFGNYEPKISTISLGVVGDGYYVDNVVVTESDAAYTQLNGAVSAGSDVTVNQVTVELDSDQGFYISYDIPDCQFDIDLIQVGGAINSTDTFNSTVYELAGNETVEVTRITAATIPMSGTFELSYRDRKLQNPFSADASKYAVRDALVDLGFSDASVSRYGNCYGYSYIIETDNTAGDHDEFTFDTTNLMGPEFESLVQTTRDGGLMLEVPSRDWFIQPTEDTRVVVTVNEIRSNCSTGNCSYDYLSASTPTVTSISPANGGAGTELTINGTMFSTVSSENTVRIGSADCNVISSTDEQIVCTLQSGAGGSHEVKVTVQTLGLASGAVSFTYDITVLSVTPNQGSLAGGTVVEICMDGITPEFCDSASISMGSSVCYIEGCDENNCVTCRTSSEGTSARRRRALEDLVVEVNGGTFSLSGGYTFITSSARVTGVDKYQLRTVLESLVIDGTGFGNEQNDSQVYLTSASGMKIGSQFTCDVFAWTDTQINCTTSKLKPGNYTVDVWIAGDNGNAETDIDPVVVVLEVSSISPQTGSLAGGTILTIMGDGFQEELLDISLGGESRCEPILVQNDMIECRVVVSKVKLIDNAGRHPTYGLGYVWDPVNAEANVGDTIRWKWASPPFVTTGARFAVWQVNAGEDRNYNGEGFKSPVPGSFSGQYEYQVTEAKTYYYSGPAVDDGNTVVMSGTISVSEAEPVVLELCLTIDGVVADYVPGSARKKRAVCTSATSAIGNCTSPTPTGIQFIADDCFTPTVSSISPQSGLVDSEITLTGAGFGSESCQNVVKFGDTNCTVTSQNDTQITCELDHNEMMEAGVSHKLSLWVNNYGYALNQMDEVLQGFIPVPEIDDITPREGSIRGGTRVTLTGSGLVGEADVRTEGLPCKVLSQSFSEIVCSTADLGFEFDTDFSVNFGSVSVPANYSFHYNETLTPVITSMSPTFIREPGTIILEGSGLSNIGVEVIVDEDLGYMCVVTASNDTWIECDVGYVLTDRYNLKVYSDNNGYASFLVSSELNADDYLTSVSPDTVSTEGGALLTLYGFGMSDVFSEDDPNYDVTTATKVTINNVQVEVISANLSQVTVLSTAGPDNSNYAVKLFSNGRTYNSRTIYLRSAATPTIASVSPSPIPTLAGGDAVIIEGTLFTTASAVFIGGSDCPINVQNDTQIECVLPGLAGGTYTPLVLTDTGLSTTSTEVEFDLIISSISTSSGSAISYGGGVTLTIDGVGFDSESAEITVCNETCILINRTDTQILCDAPNVPTDVGPTRLCDLALTQASGGSAELVDAVEYNIAVTPNITDVSPRRGGTGGGTQITISGQGFTFDGATPVVTIDGSSCIIPDDYTVTDTEIQCETEPHVGSIRTYVRVAVGDDGIAIRDNADYFYADVWSSKFTWGGDELNIPVEGDAVIVPEGQTLVIDVVTPVLKLMVVKGGTVLFDSDQAYVNLQSEYIVVSNGGTIQIGTEEEPYPSDAQITLHGNVRSIELPIYGAKVLAVIGGSIDMHGMPIETTWTLISEMAYTNDTSITLQQPVKDWKVGDQIVIASTGGESDQYQNEQHEIAGISGDFLTITLTTPLKYDHLYVNETVEGIHIHAAAEVGILSRNVRIAGSVNADWTEFIEGCDRPFLAGQFATQNCYQGKFGDEIASDQFGAHVMIHPKKNYPETATGRFSFIEVTHAGQAFRIGRYPLHYHVAGDQTGMSYVKGCSIHRTFNRALTIHGTDGLVVEHNVVYDTMGHAIFLEDGVEVDNIIEYNLAVFTKSHSSLLNVDQTPASYWIVNPDNTVRHNHAAGGSHFGFWYRLENKPSGRFTRTQGVCPNGMLVKEFYNNTAHSFGRYGLWVFDHTSGYFPKDGPGGCTGSDTLSTFGKFFAWNCDKGAETVLTGHVRFEDFLISDARSEGITMFETFGIWGDEGPGMTNVTVIGHTSISDLSPTNNCTGAGIRLPNIRQASVNGAHMINFDRDNCAAFEPWIVYPFQGGFPMQLENVQYDNAPNKMRFHWQHETWWYDLDGTFSGVGPNHTVTPWNELLSHDDCMNSTEIDAGWSRGVPAAICNDQVDFIRWAFNNPQPPSLKGNDLFVVNEWGTTTIPFRERRLTHPNGWMVCLPEQSSFDYEFDYGSQFVNMSYTGRFYFLEPEDYVIMTKDFTSPPDRFFVNGAEVNGTAEALDPSIDVNGDWHYNETTKQFSFLVSGTSSRDKRAPPTSSVERQMNPVTYQCFFPKCIPPPPPPPPGRRPLDAVYWSNATTWEFTPAGWGGNYSNGSYGMPQAGDDVIILPGLWVIIDADSLPLPNFGNLTIYGTLEVDKDVELDVTLDTEIIWIAGEGRLVAGFNEPGDHYPGNLTLHQRGNFTYPPREFVIPGGPAVGRKAIGVFGQLDLHGIPRQTYWTRLNATVEVGGTVLSLQDPTDWKAGEQIVLATTDFESFHTEVLDIDSVNEAGDEITLVSGVQHRHIGGMITKGAYTFSMSAEVGLLTRNIVIEGEDYPSLIEQSYGARVLVGRYRVEDVDYIGSASLDNVEFYHTGQEGFTATYDPRYSLAFLGLDNTILPDYPNRVVGCSFHDGFAPAIGVYGTNIVNLEQNVIHHTVGQGIIVEGRFNSVVGNLVTLMIYPGTYLDRFEDENRDWEAAIEIQNSLGTTLTDNAVAGSEKLGYHIDGEACTGTSQFTGNSAHSVLHGVHIFKQDGQPQCSRIANFVIWKAYDFGIYFCPSMTVEIENVILADNMNSIMPIIFSPNILSHQKHDKYVSIKDSLIIGESELWDCTADYAVTPEVAGITSSHRGPRASGGSKIGVVMTSFLSSPVGSPRYPWDLPKSYTNMDGKTIVSNVLITDFGDTCGKSHVVFRPNAKNGDAMHPFYLDNLEYVDTPKSNRIQYLRPSLDQVNPSDCVDMDCDAMKKLMFHDTDGTTIGDNIAGTIIPDSAFEWNGDPQRGLGDYRIPKTLLTALNGDRIPVEDVAPNQGIIGTNTGNCTWNSDWLAFECKEYDYEMMIIESMDSDTELRRLSPVAIVGDETIDLINGPMDHGWCHHYTCQKRVSTFYSIVAMNKHYEIHLTSTSPKVIRYRFLDIDDDQAVTLALYYSTPLRLDVYRNGAIIYPNNADIVDGKYILKPKDPNLPDDQYRPQLNGTVSGSNFMEKWEQTLYVLVKGPDAIEIRISDVVIVSFDIDPVLVSEFYGDDIVRNLVLLLGISEDQIRIVNVVRETSRRRKRETVNQLAVEIGDPPEGSSGSATLANDTIPGSLSVDDLSAISSNLTEMAQDGSLSASINVTVFGVGVVEPVVTPVYLEPDNTTRNDTEPIANITQPATIFLIPHHIETDTNPEYQSFVTHTLMVELKDFRDDLVENLARDWWADMQLIDSEGNPVNVSGNVTARFENGYAIFEDVIFVEYGRDYSMQYTVQGVSWAPLQSTQFDVARPQFPATDEPSAADAQRKQLIIVGSLAGGLLLIALLVIVLVVCLKKKNNQEKVGVSVITLQDRLQDIGSVSTNSIQEETPPPQNLLLIRDKVEAKRRRSSSAIVGVPTAIWVEEDGTESKLSDLRLPRYSTLLEVRPFLDEFIKTEYIFVDVANDRPYTIQEEGMENIGSGVKAKLVIRRLNIAEARVYYCFCGEMSQTKCDHCQQVSYCSDNCKQTDWCVHQNVCTGATSSSSSTSYSQPKKVKSETTKRHLQNTTLSPYLTLVEPIAKKSSTRGKKSTKQSPRWQL